MRIPKYWALGRIQKKQNDRTGRVRQITLRRWGWSDISQEDAQIHANERVGQAMEDALGQGWPDMEPLILRREPKTEYDGAHGVPIREEIISEHGQEIITRNSYGALCLNTPDVMIVDVDEQDLVDEFRQKSMNKTRFGKLIHAGAFTFIVFSMIISDNPGLWQVGLLVWISYAVGMFMLNRIRESHWLRSVGGAVGHLRSELEKEGGSWALYQTPAGARAIRLDKLDNPDEQDSIETLDRLATDRSYKALCRKQRCYRARLTPKPWRIGVERLSGHVWPLDGEEYTLREEWVSNYDRARRGWGACQWIEDIGGQASQRNMAVRELHDFWALSKHNPDKIG